MLGLGLGYAAHEYAAFGVDTARRGAVLSDLVPFLRRAWAGEAFDWAGPAYTGRDLRVTPPPVRADGIPVWLGGYAPAALRRARELADGHLIGRADDVILDELLPAWAEPVDRPFTVAVNALVLLTDDPADAEAARRGYAYAQAAYEAMQAGGIAHAGLVAPDPTRPVDPAGVDRYMQAVGDADTAVATLSGTPRPAAGLGRPPPGAAGPLPGTGPAAAGRPRRAAGPGRAAPAALSARALRPSPARPSARRRGRPRCGRPPPARVLQGEGPGERAGGQEADLLPRPRPALRDRAATGRSGGPP